MLDLRADLYRISLAYIKKERYTGSCDGLRFFLERKAPASEEEEAMIRTCLWPEPYCYEATEESAKSYREFVFSKEGLDEAVDYLMGVLHPAMEAQ